MKMQRQYINWYCVILLLALIACSKEEEKEIVIPINPSTSEKSTIATGNATDITKNTVLLNGTLDLKEEVIGGNYSFGFIYTSENDPSVMADSKNAQKVTTSSLYGKNFSVKVTGLEPNTKYHYRAFIKSNISNIVYHGDVKTFTTENFSNITTPDAASNITLTSATISFSAKNTVFNDKEDKFKIGIMFDKDRSKVESNNASVYSESYSGIELKDSVKKIAIEMKNLQMDSTYYYATYTKCGNTYIKSNTMSFKAGKYVSNYITTGKCSDVTLSTATLIGISTISSMYKDSGKYTLGIAYSKNMDEVKTVSSKHVNASNYDGSTFSVDVNGLNFNTTYYYCGYIILNGEYYYDEIRSFDTKDMNSYISSMQVTDITLNSASLSFTSKLKDVLDSYSQSIIVSTNDDMTKDATNYSISTSSNGACTTSIKSLQPATTYYYALKIQYKNSSYYTTIRSFTTKSVSNYLTTGSATNVTMTSATLNCTSSLSNIYSNPNDYSIGFIYNTSKENIQNESGSKVSANSANGKFSASISGLATEKTYYFRVYVYVGGKYYYGDIKSFETKAINSYLITESASNVTLTTATLNGSSTLSSLYSNSSSYTLGFLYNTNRENLQNKQGTKVSANSASSKFSVNLTGLTSEKTYYYRTYAYIGGTYYYSDIVQFTTKGITGRITTGSATNIKWDSATLNGKTTLGQLYSNSNDYEVGISYSTNSSYVGTTSAKLNKCTTNSSGDFSLELSSLSTNSTYYYCAYARVNGVTYYGEKKSFTTKTLEETIVTSGLVDLGLSVKWDACNFGASSPTDTGCFYAWGEINEKTNYLPDTYMFYSNKVYTDIGTNISGTIYDVAYVKSNGSKRMPTYDEMLELNTKCVWTTAIYKGVNGKIVTSNTTGKSIFLPATGFMDGTRLSLGGTCGIYWTSSITNGAYSQSKYLKFTIYSVDGFGIGRSAGCQIRAVEN